MSEGTACSRILTSNGSAVLHVIYLYHDEVESLASANGDLGCNHPGIHPVYDTTNAKHIGTSPTVQGKKH